MPYCQSDEFHYVCSKSNCKRAVFWNVVEGGPTTCRNVRSIYSRFRYQWKSLVIPSSFPALEFLSTAAMGIYTPMDLFGFTKLRTLHVNSPVRRVTLPPNPLCKLIFDNHAFQSPDICAAMRIIPHLEGDLSGAAMVNIPELEDGPGGMPQFTTILGKKATPGSVASVAKFLEAMGCSDGKLASPTLRHLKLTFWEDATIEIGECPELQYLELKCNILPRTSVGESKDNRKSPPSSNPLDIPFRPYGNVVILDGRRLPKVASFHLREGNYLVMNHWESLSEYDNAKCDPCIWQQFCCASFAFIDF